MKWTKGILFFLCLVVGASLWKVVPIQTTSGDGNEKERISAQVLKEGGGIYDIQVQYVQKNHSRYPSKKERSNFSFYLVNDKKMGIKEITPSFRNLGTYQIKGGKENILIIKEKRKVSKNGFSGVALDESETRFTSDNIMTKKVGGGTASFVFRGLYEKQPTSLSFVFNQPMEIKRVFFLSEDLSFFTKKEINKKGKNISFKEYFPVSGNYGVFLICQVDGEEKVLSYTIFVNEEEKEG